MHNRCVLKGSTHATGQRSPSFYASLGRLLLVGGGGAAVAYGIFCWLGRSWLEQYFRKQLERFKNDQQRELEQLRHQINAIFSRISKIHEKEFEVLPKAWQLLHEAHGAASRVTQAFRQWPDLDRMSEQRLDEFLVSSRLSESEKGELKQQGRKLDHYQETMFWHELNEARSAQVALNNYIFVNSIFMTEALRQQFKEINKSLAMVLFEEERNHRNPDRPDRSTFEMMGKISENFNSIEAGVQKRLRYEDA